MTPISMLVVDDNPAFLRILTRFLGEQCHTEVVVIGAVCGGQEAIVQAQALQPDIVLIDLAMPGLPGLETIARLHAALPGLGIIAMSLVDPDGYQVAALAAGADAFVSKASLNIDLLPTIKRVVTESVEAGLAGSEAPAEDGSPLVGAPPLPGTAWKEATGISCAHLRSAVGL
jgi:DNA-binding NarL/FixJ family response regulator